MFIVFQMFFATRAVLKIGEYINSRHLAQKYARIFVRGYYLFREANSFPRATTMRYEEQIMSKGKISEHILAPNGGYCLYPSSVFRNAHSFETWGIYKQ